MTVFVSQQPDALLRRKLQADAVGRAHRIEQLARQLAVPDLAALRFDEYRTARIQAVERPPQPGLEMLLTRLAGPGQTAQHGAPMERQALQGAHLQAGPGQVTEQAALGAAGGPAQHPVAEAAGPPGQRVDDQAAKRAIASLELMCAPPDT